MMAALKSLRSRRRAEQYADGGPWRTGWRRFRRNPTAVISLVILLIIIASCVLAPVITSGDYTAIDPDNSRAEISAEHIFGTDVLGRDMLTRVLYGGRVTLGVAFLSTLIASAAGVFIGILCGYFGGYVDMIVMRVMEVLSSIPYLLLVVVAETLLGWGTGNFMYAMAIAAIPSVVRIMRASVMDIMGREYIEAARALGVGSPGIIARHVFHNVAAPMLIHISSAAAEAVLTCTILGYIGIGVNPPTPEWGALVANSYTSFRSAPHMIFFPGIAVILTVLSLNLIGNGIRDALDIKRSA